MANQDPATKGDVENVVTLLQQVVEHMDRRFEAIDRRFEAVDTRLDKISDTLVYVQNQMGAMTRWSDRMDRNQNSILSTQEAQQRAIDSLAARVTRLEQRNPN